MGEPECRALEGEDDATLMAGIAAGAFRAFRTLVERHRDGVMGLAFRVTRDRGEAEDIVQEVFERVWTRASAWRPRDDGRVFAWLARIAVNLAIDRLRRPRPRRLDEVPDPPAPGFDAEQRLHGREIGRRITRALATLPDRQRTAFTLCQIERWSNADAADWLGVSVGALELLLVRARKTMRRELADLMGDEP